MVIVNVTRGTAPQVPERYEVRAQSYVDVKRELNSIGIHAGIFYSYDPASATPYRLLEHPNSGTFGMDEVYYGVKNGSLMDAVLMSRAIMRADPEEVERLIADGTDINIVNRDGETPLIQAIRSNLQNGSEEMRMTRLRMVHDLIGAGVDVNAPDDEGGTALFYAVIYGSDSIVQDLINTGADIEVSDIAGYTPLDRAVAHGRLPIVKFLVDAGARTNARSVGGNTLLHRAAALANEQTVQYLLDIGLNSAARNDLGLTPEAMARRADRNDIADLIRDYVPEDIKEPEGS